PDHRSAVYGALPIMSDAFLVPANSWRNALAGVSSWYRATLRAYQPDASSMVRHMEIVAHRATAARVSPSLTRKMKARITMGTSSIPVALVSRAAPSVIPRAAARFSVNPLRND